MAYNKIKLYNISDCWSRDILNFYFSQEGLGLASPPYFLHVFFFKNYFSFHVLLNEQISLSFCLTEMLDNRCIVIICCPVVNVLNFEINQSPLIILFLFSFLGLDKIWKREGEKLMGLGTLCQLWELHISGKAALTCWRVKCGKTASLKTFSSWWILYICFLLDLIQVSRARNSL